MKKFLLVLCLLLPMAGIGTPFAADGRVFPCATSSDIHAALKVAGPGDTILLEGGSVYEIDRSLQLRADGTEDRPIRFTSRDSSDQDRFAVITTAGGKKAQDLVAIRVLGSYWNISRIEVAGARVPLADGYWDTNGFQLGLYLLGPGSHHNVIEDVHIHDTHNAAIAVRDESHHNTFRRINIHHIGEWLNETYNAHEGEGFYLGSSKGYAEAGNKARVHDILIEDSILGPGLLGQFVDIKYAASAVTVRNNVFHCGEKTYNEEIVKVAGYGNLIENNRFIGANPRLTRYIHVFNKKTIDPVRVDYGGKDNVPAPTGRDNTVVNNVFQTDNPDIRPVDNDVAPDDRPTVRIEGNRTEPLAGLNPSERKST